MRRRAALAGALGGGAAVLVAAAAGLVLTHYTAGSASAQTPAKLSVSGGYIPQPLLTDLAAAYFTVTNSGGSAAELTSVSTPLAAHVTLHTTTGTTMEQVGALTVPAHGRLTLGVGGNHLMLENLDRKPRVGAKVTLTLRFTHATPATMTVTVPVRPTTYHPEG
ncbi:copper chaperone PCu(A)C [Streptomyces sp. NBC_01190]|uniref:copper chaperone PCu(A)C n=1 Tax=Streptomyces sp. NBC_01190 TaxID=2903767 RepID=UPI00386BF341|nr:copper chaperone PCu(A)C [Streptomyces sp. NBC_01190]